MCELNHDDKSSECVIYNQIEYSYNSIIMQTLIHENIISEFNINEYSIICM